MKTNEWTIAGVGAMGSLLAGHFCEAGHDVKLLLKNQDQLDTYETESLTLHLDDHVITHHPQAQAIEHVQNESIDRLLCCVKAFDATSLLLQLKDQLHEKSIVIMLHNGMGVLEEIQSQLPDLRIISSISTFGGYLDKPFSVKSSLQGDCVLGPAIGHFTDSEIESVCASFQEAKLPYRWDNHIQTRIWEKFALNCCINILTALWDCKNGGLMEHTKSLKKLALEVSTVICAYGVLLSPEDLLERVLALIEKTADNYSSMYMDIQRGQGTEIDYLNEYLTYLAQQKNIETPFNNTLLNQFYVKLQEIGAP